MTNSARPSSQPETISAKINRLLPLILPLVIAQPAHADESCIRDIGSIDYERSACEIRPSLSISKFTSKKLRKNEKSLEMPPISIIISKNLEEIRSITDISGGGAPAPIFFLPYQEEIDERQPLNSSASRRLTTKGWSAKGEVVRYHANESDAGMTLVCGVASRSIRNKYVSVSQCTSFYKKDIETFHKALKAAEREISARP